MRTEELRIGNLVQDEHGSVMYVYRLWKGGAELASNMDGFDDLDYEDDEMFGVPLTEEWLVRAGFDVKENSSWATGEEQKFKVFSKGNFTYNSIQGLWWFFGKVLPNQPKYVHKLQNIYYELVDQELEFTP